MGEGMRILVASDGSESAKAAMRVGMALPWPKGSTARGVVAVGIPRLTGGAQLRQALADALHAIAGEARECLAARWPGAEVVEKSGGAVEAIEAEARRFGADVIVLGWRGHGTFGRLLVGSVSRGVAARARSSVLVVREDGLRGDGPVRRLAVGFDGSANSRAAIRFVSRLDPARGNRVALVTIVRPPVVPGYSRVPREARALVREAIAERREALLARAHRRLAAAARTLRLRGWRVTEHVVEGAPLEGLLAEARRARAQLLVVGARGTSGLAHVLLGSVASGALDQAHLPVVIAR